MTQIGETKLDRVEVVGMLRQCSDDNLLEVHHQMRTALSTLTKMEAPTENAAAVRDLVLAELASRGYRYEPAPETVVESPVELPVADNEGPEPIILEAGPSSESIIGPPGPPGESIVGPSGPPGKSVVGPKGDMGDTVVGPPGPPCETVVGPPGPPGESIVGPSGPPGETIVGPRGEKGDSIVGPPGPPGETVVGPKGERGPVGRGIINVGGGGFAVDKTPQPGDVVIRSAKHTWTTIPKSELITAGEGIVSDPPSGQCRVLNIYATPDGKLAVDWDDTPVG